MSDLPGRHPLALTTDEAATLFRLKQRHEVATKGRKIQGEAYQDRVLRFRLHDQDARGLARLVIEEDPTFERNPRRMLECRIGVELADNLIEALAEYVNSKQANWNEHWVRTPNTNHRPNE